MSQVGKVDFRKELIINIKIFFLLMKWKQAGFKRFSAEIMNTSNLICAKKYSGLNQQTIKALYNKLHAH